MALAQELSLRTGEEAALRSAVSRAYYSVYHQARIRLNSNNVSIPPDDFLGSHQRQWKVFREHLDVNCKRIGVNGDRLREFRTRADYRDDITNIQSEAKSSLMLAVGIVGSLGALPRNVP